MPESEPDPSRIGRGGSADTATAAGGGPGILPLGFPDGDAFSCRAGQFRTAGDLWRDAALVRLPQPQLVNLCADRHAFLAGLAAALSDCHTTLLPSSAVTAAETALRYSGCGVLDDAAWPPRAGAGQHGPLPMPQQDFVALVGHTSGSTGAPVAHPKRWSSLRATTALNAAAIRALLPDDAARPWIVATVPSQHMYGMELAALLPLLAGFAIHAGHPLFPADIAAALAEVPRPRILVTTPVHLRSLLQSGIVLPPVDVMVSATAPLSQDLAREVETRFATRLLEMFGSTETCVFAARRTALEDTWQPYPGVRLVPGANLTEVSAPWLDGAVPLQDIVELHEDGRFGVIGRNTDLVDVAGKRASLADITRRITALPGVQDAYVLQPDEPDGIGVRRVAALVVAPGADPAALLDGLRTVLDAAFLPRPLVIVDALPRNAVGKIPRGEALRMLREVGSPSVQSGDG